MENKTINVALHSSTVVGKMSQLHMNEMDAWNVFFDSGLEYLENLKRHVRRKRVFDEMFGRLLGSIGSMSPVDVFNRITAAPEFWQWWSSCFWFACRDPDIQLQELTSQLLYSRVLIPNSVMKQIFENESIQQDTKTKPRINSFVESAVATC